MTNADFEGFWEIGSKGISRVCEDATAGGFGRVYDLEERTAPFGEGIIKFAQRIPVGPVNNRLIDQLVGCGTSVGANYCEADDGFTPRDFRHKIGLCRKEAKETKYFLRMIATAVPALKPDALSL